MNNIALIAKLTNVVYFGVDCGEEDARIFYFDAVSVDIGNSVVSREAHARVIPILRVPLAALALLHLHIAAWIIIIRRSQSPGLALRGQELHNASDGVLAMSDVVLKVNMLYFW